MQGNNIDPFIFISAFCFWNTRFTPETGEWTLSHVHLLEGKPVDLLVSGWLTLDLVMQFVVKGRALYLEKEPTLIRPTKWL